MNRVLIVDDEPDIASLVTQCLDPLGVEVVQASSLSSARSVGEQGIDVVLLDLALGSEDGLEILDELRGSPGLSNAPVVVFSAHDSRRAEALERGVDEFLARPFAFQDLQSMVARHLKRV
ncbi:MAG: response regulator [Acidimicrobiales bacterium]